MHWSTYQERRFVALLVLLLGSWRSSLASGGERLRLDLESLALSQAVPVVDYFDDFGGGLDEGGEIAYTNHMARLTLERGQWQYSAFYRYDFFLDFVPATGELYYREENGFPLEVPRDYRVDLRASNVAAWGLGVERRFALTDSIELGARLNGLAATRLVDGRIDGNLAVDAAGDLQGSADIEYFYTEDYLFDRPDLDRPLGWGASADLFLTAALPLGLGLRVRALDVASRIRWSDAPVTRARADTATTTLDPEGLFQVRPVLSGIEAYQDFDQQLPSRFFAEVDLDRVGVRWTAELRHVRDTTFLRGHATVALTPETELRTTVAFTTRALGVGLRHRRLEVFLLSDALRPSAARTLELRVSLGFPR
jgi:hypothetical protein